MSIKFYRLTTTSDKQITTGRAFVSGFAKSQKIRLMYPFVGKASKI
jgi:hypothetical protein